MKKILVPVDGSKHSQKALLMIKDCCIFNSCELCIITVVNTMRNCDHLSNQEFKGQLCKKNIEYGEKILKESTQLLNGFPGKVQTKLLCNGDIADGIINVAESEGYDLVVMGNRGLGSFSKTLLGSVSNKVVNNIKVSTLIVK